MSRLIIDTEALRHNLDITSERMKAHGASWSVVTKVLCGHEETLRALHILGVRSVADSRLDNLETLKGIMPESEGWYLRPPPLSEVDRVVELCTGSLNTELETLHALSEAAGKRDKVHQVVLMVEIGDLREGIAPGSVTGFYRKVEALPNLNIVGLGAQVGCLSGAAPNPEQLEHLRMYRELIELKFDARVPIISAGSSVFLPLLDEGWIPREINHFRIGEALFLGTDLYNGGTLDGYRDDVVRIEAEILEIKEKSMIPTADAIEHTPFQKLPEEEGGEETPRRGYRALVALGQLDTEVSGLTPVDDDHRIVGASSDIMAVYLGQEEPDLSVGDRIAFQPGYGALARAMNNPYLDKGLSCSLEELELLCKSTPPRTYARPLRLVA